MYKKIIIGLAFSCYMSANVEVKPLHILFVVSYFPAPSQIYILHMMTRLIDLGHKVSIFAVRKENFPPHPDVLKYSLLDSVIYEQLPAQLPECDIVFCQSASLGKKIIEDKALATWLKKRKIVVCLRGYDITSEAIKQDPKVYRQLFNKADLFLPVCHYFKKLAMQLGCASEKLVVYHSAIDCVHFVFKKREHKKNETVRFVSVCRLVEKKGLKFALKAIAAINKKVGNWYFTIVGSGHLQKTLEKLAKKLKIAHKVTFFGWGTQDQVAAILDQSHIFLSPSITTSNGDEEGIANAIKEAMAAGLISIATQHAGTPELIDDGVSGFLVPERDSRALAQKILYVIAHPEIWESVGLAGRKKIEAEFEITQCIKQLEQLFYTLLE